MTTKQKLPHNFRPGSPASFAEYASKRSQIVAACKVEEVVIEDVDPVVEEDEIAKPGENIEKMKAYLSTCPAGATVADIMAATGIPEGSIRSSLNWSAGLFEQVDVTRAGKRVRKLWRVRRAVAA